MVSTVLSLTGLAAVSSYLYDAVTPMQMVEGRKIYAIYNWASIAMAFVATAASIAAFVSLNAPVLFLGIALIAVSLVASYTIKQLALKASIEKDAATLQGFENGMREGLAQQKEKIGDLAENLQVQTDQLGELNEETDEWQKGTHDLGKQTEQLNRMTGVFQEQFNSFSKGLGTYQQIAEQSGQASKDLESIADTMEGAALRAGETVSRLQQVEQNLGQQAGPLGDQLNALNRANRSLHQFLEEEGAYQKDTRNQIQGVYDIIAAVRGGSNDRSSK